MEDSQLKQRLVGAIVLVSLGIIFIPMILSGGDPSTGRSGETSIPKKPDRDFVSRIIPLDKQAPEPAPISAPADSKPKVADTPKPVKIYKAPVVAKIEKPPAPTKPPVKVTKTAPKPVAKTPSKPKEGWIAQVGSFSSKSNAYGLRDKLRKKGFSSFVDSIKTNGKSTYRVRIGPEAQKDRAAALLARATKITKTKGFVARYP